MWNHHMFCIDNLIKTLQQYHKIGIVITFVLQRKNKKYLDKSDKCTYIVNGEFRYNAWSWTIIYYIYNLSKKL